MWLPQGRSPGPTQIPQNCCLLAEAVEKARKTGCEDEERFDGLDVQLAMLRSFVRDCKDLKTGLSSLAQGVTDMLNLVNSKGVEIEELSTWKQVMQAQLLNMIATSVQSALDTQLFGGDYHSLIIQPLMNLLFDTSSWTFFTW